MLAVTLVAGCDYLVENYEFDTEGYGQSNWEMLDYCESPAANAYDNYSKAMRLAGLDEVVAEGGYTCIIPNNDAFTSFVSAAGYASLDEVPGPVLRDLLSYLIFPGDYRATTMEVGEECTVNSLRGEPITISRSASEKSYTLTINGVNGLAGITVESQDYLFKNNVVGQMVEQMPYYRPTIAVTSPKPENFDNSNAPTQRIDLTDDTFIAYANKTKVYDNDSQGIRLQNRSSMYCYGLVRYPLPESEIVENLAVATMVMQIQTLGTPYPSGTPNVRVAVNEMNDAVKGSWEEKTATWASVVGSLSHTKLRAALAGETTFTSPSPLPSTSASMELKVDITGSILDHYAAGDTAVDYVLYNTSDIVNTSGAEIQIKDKDKRKDPPYILLVGPVLSALTVGAVNPLVTTSYTTTLTTDVLRIDAPADAGGYDYSPQNILLVLSEVPVNGVLTLYGIPVQKNQKFTYEELQRGFVKYVRVAEGEDSFKLKVMDYLDGMIPDPVTINVQ